MPVSYGTNLNEARADITAQATDTVLVAAVTGRKIGVAYVFVMADTAMTVTLESGTSTLKFRLFPGANGGATVSAPSEEYLFETAAGEALTVSTSGAGNCYVHVLYGVV